MTLKYNMEYYKAYLLKTQGIKVCFLFLPVKESSVNLQKLPRYERMGNALCNFKQQLYPKWKNV